MDKKADSSVICFEYRTCQVLVRAVLNINVVHLPPAHLSKIILKHPDLIILSDLHSVQVKEGMFICLQVLLCDNLK